MNAAAILCCCFVIFLSNGPTFTNGVQQCKINENYLCGTEDCNCNDGLTLYERFLALFSRGTEIEKTICDKCKIICTNEKQINCLHGVCDKQKGCVCQGCWSGESCSKYKNRHSPKFTEKTYKAEIKSEAKVGEVIIQVYAIDPDIETCNDKTNCPCGRIIYSITKGNAEEVFNINQEDGKISLQKELTNEAYSAPFVLQVTAENSGQESENSRSFVVVSISASQKVVRNRRSTHHRVRRSTQVYNSLLVNFSTPNETIFVPGSSINYTIVVSQNQSTSPEALTVVLININSTNLNIDSRSFNVNGASSAVTVVDASNVKYSHTGTFTTSSELTIEFGAIVKYSLQPLASLRVGFFMTATASGTTSVTYGPVYSSPVYAAYPAGIFSRNPSGDVRVESNLDYAMNITLPYFNFSLILEISTTVNKFRFLSIESVTINETSSSVVLQNSNPVPVKYTGVEDGITSRVVLDFGKVKVLNKNQNENTIKVAFSVKVNDHFLLENQSSHWVGVGMNTGNEMLWVGQDEVIIYKDEPYLIAEIETTSKTVPTRYYIGDLLRFSWKVSHANFSYASAKKPIIVFIFANSTTEHSVTMNNGENFSKTTKTTSDGRASIECTLVATDFPQSKTVTGSVVTKVEQANFMPLSDLSVHIQLHYQTPNAVDRPKTTYKPEPGYQAGVPIFNLSTNCSERKIKIGQVAEIQLEVLVTNVTFSGNIEVVFPVQGNSTIIRWVNDSFSVTNFGSNLDGTGISNPQEITTSTNSDNYIDRVTINMGNVNNKVATSAATSIEQNNVIIMKFKIILEENTDVNNGSKYWIGVGVKGGDRMVWVGQLAFIANVLPDRRPIIQIVPEKNDTNLLVQGDVVEYNFTISHVQGSGAHGCDIEVLWMLPAYTKFLAVERNSRNLQMTKPNGNILFKMEKLEFLEEPVLAITLQLDPLKTLKTGKNFAVTPVALTYKDKRTQETFYEPLVPVSVAFNVPDPIKENVADESYDRGYIVDTTTSSIYFCKVSEKMSKPSCFWSNTKGSEWRAIDILVINIIGIDNTNDIVYGIGNNKNSYMRCTSQKCSWVAISKKHWEKAQTSAQKNIIKIESTHGNEGDPEQDKVVNVNNGEKWGANNLGIYHYTTSGGWKQKALWHHCN